jgi:uncharacterized membrane protein
MTTTPPPAPMTRGLRILLVVSLALNLLVAGLVIGRLLDGRPDGGRPMAVDLPLGPFARALSPEDRRMIGRDLLGDPALRDMRRSVREADLAALAAVLRAEPFDSAAAAAVISGQSQKMRALEQAVEEALLARFAVMTPAERGALADRLMGEARRAPHD